MRLVFAGTPDFAVPSLRALCEAGHAPCTVYTQPDRPAGRGRHVQVSAVKREAVERGLPVRQPHTLRDPDVQSALCDLGADLMVVAAYGLILPRPVLEAPRLGCINVHASLLPRWRGAAPIARAIEAGDSLTGVTLMQMEEGLDTGPMLAQRETRIRPEDNAASLHDRLSVMGAELLLAWLPDIAAGRIVPEPQDPALVTYAAKLERVEAEIDWTRPASSICCKVRAFNPWPVAHSYHDGVRIRVLSADQVAGEAAPGRVMGADAGGITVACGDGALRIRRLQRDGGRPLEAGDFLNGYVIKVGDRFRASPGG